MNFEEKLLVELKAEMADRATRETVGGPRRITGRRWVAGTAVAGVAAAGAVAVPLVTGSATPAYAITSNADGSVTVKINEFRHPDRLQADLAARGIRSDITYLAPGKNCAADPFPGRHGHPTDPATWPIQDTDNNEYKITPQHIAPAQTLVLRFKENPQHTSAVLGFWLGNGPVKPCKIVNGPTWNPPTP